MIVSSDTMVGIGNASARLTTLTGASGNSVAWEWKNGNVYLDGSHANISHVTGSAADVIAFAFDFNHRKFLGSNNLTTGSGWNSGDVIARQNPTMTGTGGYSVQSPAGPGPYFLVNLWWGVPGD